MAYKRKTWQEKLHSTHPAKVEVVERRFADIPEGAKMYIATPEIVDAYMRHIPEGKHASIGQMRSDLAIEHHAEYTCPITSGIFMRIAAEAAYEDYLAGKSVAQITPFWRMIDSKSPLAKKLSFGTDFVKEQRKKEGLSF